MSINDGIKRYVCKINYNPETFTSEGSGVVVNMENDEYFYVLTAKHTFFTHTNNEEMDENEIFKEKIKIVDYKNETLLLGNESILKVIGIDKQYDFLIFVIKKEKQIKGLDALFIYEDDFKECKICGYPNSKISDKNKVMLLPCSYNTKDEERSTYEVNSNILLEAILPNLNANEKMKGISGSGIFVESATSKIYLAGIQIATASHNALVCLDIRILAKEINEALKSHKYNPIPIDGYVVKDELGINTDELNFGEMLNKLKDEVFDKQGLKDKSYTEILKAFNENIKHNLEQNSKELANKYLYLSLLFHREKDNRRSTIYFKKAVRNNPSYYALFLKGKDERDLTEKEKKKYADINLEVSNSDVSADDLFLEMLESKITQSEEFDEKEGIYIQMIKLLEAQLRELNRDKKNIGNEIEKKENILKKSIELFNLYLNEEKLDIADKLLLGLKDKEYDVYENLYQLYSRKKFLDITSSSKQELSIVYLDLLERFKDDKNKFNKLREQLNLLYQNNKDNVVDELHSVKKKMTSYEEQVTNLVDIFTEYIQDEKVLEKVDNVTREIKNSHAKLDSIDKAIRQNHSAFLDTLGSQISQTNRDLVSRVQKIYKKNIKKDKEIKEAFNGTVADMHQELKTVSIEDNQNYIENIQSVVKKYNIILYKGIKKLYVDNQDTEKNRLFMDSLQLAEKRHQEHLVSLKKSLFDKNKQILEYSKEINKLEKDISELLLNHQKNKQNVGLKEDKILELEERYSELEKSIKDSEDNEFSKAEKTIYENKILDLKKSIEQLKGKNQQVAELKSSINSITKSSGVLEELTQKQTENRDFDNWINILEEKYQGSKDIRKELDSLKSLNEGFSTNNKQLSTTIERAEKTTKELQKLESTWKTTLTDIEKRFTKVAYNPRNQTRLKRIQKQIETFEKTLDEVKRRGDVFPIKRDSKITLHLLKSDLEKIELLVQNYRRTIYYDIYCKTRFVILGSGITVLIILAFVEKFSKL